MAAFNKLSCASSQPPSYFCCTYEMMLAAHNPGQLKSEYTQLIESVHVLAWRLSFWVQTPTRTIQTSRFSILPIRRIKKMNARSVLVVALVQVFNCFHPNGSHVVQDQPRHQTKHEHQASHQTRCLGGISEEQTRGEMFEACWLRWSVNFGMASVCTCLQRD